MESGEFDAALGGSETLPHSANSLKFAASRSVEIAAMTESILRPSKTKLIFQSLPVHMRRRVMSHNCKRLPRRLRESQLEQLKKSGISPQQKRKPSRKHRRRKTNLLEEYNRRQRRNIWLETHIWHAKRFHMVERWGHHLAYRPSDKAFRACYRASSAHCLMQDISYYTPIQIKGPVDIIRDLFSNITDNSCGLGVCAKAYINGNREGTINLYKPNCYPYDFIGQIDFLWISSDTSYKEMWLFVHPSQAKIVENVLTDLVSKSSTDLLNIDSGDNLATKRRKISTKYSDVIIKPMAGIFNRIRLTGPKSHAVLVQSLKCVDNIENVQSNNWIQHLMETEVNLLLKEKKEYWEQISSLTSPSQLSPRLIFGLVIKDPRWSRPAKRTKAQNSCITSIDTETLINVPPYLSSSPLWDTSVCDIIKDKKITNAQFIEHVTKTHLVPGEINEDDPTLQCIPIILIQRPGSQNSDHKKIGYGCGWDIIIPSGYGLPFWLTLIMFGARSGGLRETENLAFEMGQCYLPPDSEAGRLEEIRIESELKEKYFRRPPSKRVNFVKLAVPYPFICPWKILLKDWGNNVEDKMFVLRDKKILDTLQDCINNKKKVPKIDNSDACLVPVYIKMQGKGNLTKYSTICLPLLKDINASEELMEPHHEDPNTKLRKQKRMERQKLLKQRRRKRIKLRKKQTVINQKTKRLNKTEPSEYVKTMRELWLPSNVESVRNKGIREVMGYVSQGAFSFSEANICGIGYVAYNAIMKLDDNYSNKVLVRCTTSRKYRLANIHIVKSP
ncbi:ribonucleases P/MRP protein subunit POP1 [Vanessa cardui]|uniref:ribonucleases P/MRP protein subunit POP1 n=1 Tax=Vanessa cardui TaxID=171605 RepID=UPI001F14765A|nr:ribonucleases P/MRP protein subunit POP1 [Vanessa cardui]